MVNLLTLVILAQAENQGVSTIANRTERPKFLGPGLRRNDERSALFQGVLYRYAKE